MISKDDIANWSPEQARAFLRKIIGPERRRIDGVERDNILLMCKLVEPTSSSNNQRTLTEVYMINQKEFHITYWLEDEAVVEEIMPDDSNNNT